MRLILAGLVVLAAWPGVAAARAQEGCASHAEIAAFLARDHQEQAVASGIANNGGVVEVFADPDGESWTLLITLPDGQTCMMAAGHSWMEQRDDPTVATTPDPGT